MMLGVFQAACNPPAYSILADYFHPKYRTTANSIYSLGIYIGGALSSLTVLIITGVGWRWMFILVGIIGMGAGVIGFVFIKEPKRGNFDPKKPDNFVAVKKPSPLVQFLASAKEIF